MIQPIIRRTSRNLRIKGIGKRSSGATGRDQASSFGKLMQLGDEIIPAANAMVGRFEIASAAGRFEGGDDISANGGGECFSGEFFGALGFGFNFV